LYNQILRTIAINQRNDVVANARLFALVNMAMADAAIQSWASKYAYKFWRPVVAIRATGERWFPYGALLSNKRGINFTPNFPAYNSGHATIGAAMFRTVLRFYGTDDIPFSFVSDELNGKTRDSNGRVRPRIVRHFHRMSQASEENGQSRIYLGIHWEFDKTRG